jgi:hypothetical protein
MAGLIALFAWSPWKSPSEADWLGAYRSWSDGIEVSVDAGIGGSRESCESSYDDEVGDPPAERLEPMAAAARGGCATLSADGWRGAQAEVVRALAQIHCPFGPPRQRRDLSEVARSSVGVRADVYCWRPAAWAAFAEQYAFVRGGKEIRLTGIADTERKRIDLEPGVCATLDRYLRRIRPTKLSTENLELAEALVVLTHEAEHLRSPSASETEVECYAVQHVRPLIRAAGWEPAFQTEIALHAWELGYTQLPAQFRMPECRNGGPLDRHPESNAWP